MTSPQPTDSHLRLAVSIQEELILRDFSKRQYKIINLILRVSWACGKKYAVIPQYTKYFKACGIYKSDVKNELDILVKNRVLFWNCTQNLFEFNKNFDEWLIPYHKESNKNSIKELISLNLRGQHDTNSVSKIQTRLENNTNPVRKIIKLADSEKALTESKEDMPITSIITNNYNELLNILKQVKNYPYNEDKDIKMIKNLAKEYPEVNLVEALMEWGIYKLDKPLDSKSNPRSQICTWIKKGVGFGKYKKTINEEDLEFTRQRVEYKLEE